MAFHPERQSISQVGFAGFDGLKLLAQAIPKSCF
jgi:hypothetical protein